METPCDILILTASFGLGHNSVSRAIQNQIQKQDSRFKVDIIDIFDVIDPKRKQSSSNLYKILTQKYPKIYNFSYRLKSQYKNNILDEPLYMLYFKRFYRYIEKKQPQLIISTFPLCSGFVSRVKKRYTVEIPTITVITDVVDSWEWVHEYTDLYFVPSHTVEQKLIHKGVPKEKIRITGIPVKDEFLEGIAGDGSTKQVLIMASAMDKLEIDKDFLKALHALNNVRTVIVTGSNKVLYEQLKEKNEYDNIEIIGYTTEIAKLMDQSSLLVTKPGGVTLFESINKEIPLVIRDSNIGQEKYNIQFIRDTGIGVLVDESMNMLDTIMGILNNQQQLCIIKENIHKVKNQLETNKIGAYVLELI